MISNFISLNEPSQKTSTRSYVLYDILYHILLVCIY